MTDLAGPQQVDTQIQDNHSSPGLWLEKGIPEALLSLAKCPSLSENKW